MFAITGAIHEICDSDGTVQSSVRLSVDTRAQDL